MRKVLEDLRWGGGWGLVGGVFYAILGTGIFFLTGGSTPERGPNAYVKLLALYLVGGAGVGVIVGLSRPFVRKRIGATLVGMVAAIPLGIVVEMLFAPKTAGREDAVIGTILGAMLVGGIAGWQWWELHDVPSGTVPPPPSNPERKGNQKGRKGKR